MKSGKRFENNFKNSITENIYYYRFKDGTSSWDKGSNTRFQAQNKCDCELFYKNTLFNIELKSHKGKSIPITCIRDNQLKELLYASSFGIKCGIVIEFSDLTECYYLDIEHLSDFLQQNDRKSVPIDYVAKNGFKIDIEKKKVNIKLDIEKLLDDIIDKIEL